MKQSITNVMTPGNLLANLGWVALILALLLIIIMLSILGWRQAQYGGTDPARRDFLKAHIVGKGPLAGPIELNFPTDFYHRKLYLLGEIHGRAAPQILDLALLKHLHQTMGLRDYLAEIDPIEAAYFNAFLESGNDDDLKPVFDFWRNNVRWGNTNFREKLHQIRAYNQTLPADQRIRFTGIDEIHNINMLESWLSGSPQTSKCREIRKCAASYLPKVEAASADKLLGGEKTKAEVVYLLGVLSQPIEREDVFFKSYSHQVTTGSLKDRPAYGLWGSNHVVRASMNGQKAFAELVRLSDLPARNDIVSLQIFSSGGKMMIGNMEMKGLLKDKSKTGRVISLFEDDGPLTWVPGIGDLKSAAPQAKGITIFKLNDEKSPYRVPTGLGQFNSIGLKSLKFDKPTPATAESFDYAILLHGSESVTPLP